MDIKALLTQVENLRDEAVTLRRDFHKYAESSWQEYRTTCKIAEYLEGIGLPVFMGTGAIHPDYVVDAPCEAVKKAAMERALAQGARPDLLERTEGYPGLVTVIETGKPGPVVALRFDIDANECTEPTDDPNHEPAVGGYASVNAGSQHACGHDAHITIGLMTCKLLQAHREQLRGTVKVLFQPAEEGVRGAEAMVHTGVLEDVDYFLSGHVGFGAKTIDTFIASCTGLLATSKVNAYFHGTPAHAGASPESGHSALLAAAAAALMMHSQCQDGRGAARVNVGVMRAGSARNVVPAEAELLVETRGLTTEINQDMMSRAENSIRGAAAAYGCTVDIVRSGGAVSADSDRELADFAADTVRKYGLAKQIESDFYFGASEDVTYLMKAVQSHGGMATYMMYGTEIKAPHHNDKFDMNEEVLVTATKTVCAITVRTLLEK